jgi:hypothetical protein
MTDVDISIFKKETFGLPDSCILDKDGNLSQVRFEDALGIPRKFRPSRGKASKGGSQPTIEIHSQRKFRANHFCTMVTLQVANKLPIIPAGDQLASWEAQVFNRFVPGWHLTQIEKCIALSALDEQEREKITETFRALAGKMGSDTLLALTYEIYAILQMSLDNWHDCEEGRRQLLADVAFGCFTLLGPDVMELAVKKAPTLFDYYTHLMGKVSPARQKTVSGAAAQSEGEADAGLDAPAQTKGEDTDIVETMLSFYEQVEILAAAGIGCAQDTTIADRIEVLVLTHLPRLRKLQALPDSEVKALFAVFSNRLIAVGRSLELAWFSEDAFLDLFREVWVDFFSDRLKSDVSADYFQTCFDATRAIAEAAGVAFIDANVAFVTAELQVETQRELLQKASFRQKREAEAALAEAQGMEGQRKLTLTAAENAAIQALLPEGLQLEQLPDDGYQGSFDQAQFHPVAMAALLTWRNGLAPAIVEDDDRDMPCTDEQPEHVNALTIPALPDSDKDSPAAVAPHDSATTETPTIAEPMSAPIVPPTTAANAARPVAKSMPVEPHVPAMVDVNAAPVEPAPCPVEVVHTNAEGVRATEYLESAAEAENGIRTQFETHGKICATLVENIALHWLLQGHLNFAHATLTIAESCSWLDGHPLSPSLFRSAYFGLNVWPGDQVALAKIQRQLNFMIPQQLEELMDRRPGGKVVPYLLLAASLQTTLFTGNRTMAPRLLGLIANRFDRATERLLQEMVAFSDKGYSVDLDALRKQPQADDKQQRAKLLTTLSNWRDRIANKQTGWAPARKALRDCVHLPEFAATIETIEQDSGDEADAVRGFVEKYSHPDTVFDLMKSQINKLEKRDNPSTIESFARITFQNSILELCQIAQNWLSELQSRFVRGDETRTFATRLLTQLRSAQNELQLRTAPSYGFEHRCGATLAIKAIGNLLQAIEGNASAIWNPKRADAFFTLPAELMASEGLIDDPEGQFSWLVEHSLKMFDTVVFTDEALKAQDYRVARLLLLLRKDAGEDVAQHLLDVDKLSADNRHQLLQQIHQMRTMVDNAALSNLLDDERAYQIRAELEYQVEEIDKLETLDSLQAFRDEIQARERELETKLGGALDGLQRQLEELLNQSRAQIGPDAVPDGWVTEISRAMKERNLPVVEEMLDHLKTSIKEGTAVRVEDIGPNPYLQGFLEAEPLLFSFLDTYQNAREVAKQLVASKVANLDYSHAGSFKDAIEILAELRANPKKTLDKALYESLSKILACLGLPMVNPNYSADMPAKLKFDKGALFIRLSLDVNPGETGRPFPLFEQGGTQITVVLAQRDWKPIDLKQYLEIVGTPHQRIIFLCAKALTNELRNAFAKQSKKDQATIFHVDPVMLAYLSSIAQHQNPLRHFLLLSVPWTYYNPYTPQDTLRPAPEEMRYGRQDDVQKLIAMQGGAAIIYGGRQLGKTTILHEAVRVFNKTPKSFAFYRQMDRDMDRLKGISKNAWEQARIRVWNVIYQALVEADIIASIPNIESKAMVNAVDNELRRDGATSVLMCFDEIDPILELDAANNFGIFRGLSDLVNQPNRRFKVVIAGLQNVKRFEDAPNFPLPQLGRSLRVSILPMHDAVQLVREPLQILGYEFEDPLLANRILVITNRHPGLIHIFCHELVLWMGRKNGKNVGAQTIGHADVERIEQDSEVTRLIRNRFDMTLNLDKRYLVIVYGLISHNRTAGAFTSAQAKEIAEQWLPAEFKHLTQKQFEAFLIELVGLGVLREDIKESRSTYSLRNVLIMNLVGSAQEIEDKLLRAVEDIQQDNPLFGHAFPMGLSSPSPLTFRDEKQLITADGAGGRELGDRSTMYSVGIITGSEALGLDIERFEEIMPSLGDFEESKVAGKDSPRYLVKAYVDTNLTRASEFRSKLDAAITALSKSNPIMMLVKVDGEMSLAHTLDMLSMAHELGTKANNLTHRVRVLFLMGPKALWMWQAKPDLTSEQELQQPFIGLDRWNSTGVSHLLNHLGLENTVDDIAALLRYSQGWYFSLKLLVQIKATKKKEAGRLSDFNTLYTPLLEAKAKEQQAFLVKSGLTSVRWGIPLVSQLLDPDGFDLEVLQLVLMEPEFGPLGIGSEVASMVLAWLERLRLVEPKGNSSQSGGVLVYRLTDSVVAAVKAIAQPDARRVVA